jgi:hypothetical protein
MEPGWSRDGAGGESSAQVNLTDLSQTPQYNTTTAAYSASMYGPFSYDPDLCSLPEPDPEPLWSPMRFFEANPFQHQLLETMTYNVSSATPLETSFSIDEDAYGEMICAETSEGDEFVISVEDQFVLERFEPWYLDGGYPYTQSHWNGSPISLHRLILPLHPSLNLSVDHINRDKLDARRINLRPAGSLLQKLNRFGTINGESCTLPGLTVRRTRDGMSVWDEIELELPVDQVPVRGSFGNDWVSLLIEYKHIICSYPLGRSFFSPSQYYLCSHRVHDELFWGAFDGGRWLGLYRKHTQCDY